MNESKHDSKKYCKNCKHFGYCDRANICDGNCTGCDDDACENNKDYKENDNGKH